MVAYLFVLLALLSWQVPSTKYDSYHQTTTRAHCDLLAISQVRDPDLEAVATGTRVVEYLEFLIEGHVFDFYFIIYVRFVDIGGSHGDRLVRRSAQRPLEARVCGCKEEEERVGVEEKIL